MSSHTHAHTHTHRVRRRWSGGQSRRRRDRRRAGEAISPAVARREPFSGAHAIFPGPRSRESGSIAAPPSEAPDRLLEINAPRSRPRARLFRLLPLPSFFLSEFGFRARGRSGSVGSSRARSRRKSPSPSLSRGDSAKRRFIYVFWLRVPACLRGSPSRGWGSSSHPRFWTSVGVSLIDFGVQPPGAPWLLPNRDGEKSPHDDSFPSVYERGHKKASPRTA